MSSHGCASCLAVRFVVLSILCAAALACPAVWAQEDDQVFVIHESGLALVHPPSWSPTPGAPRDMKVLLRVPAEKQGTEAALGVPRIVITIEERKDGAEAVRRLKEIEAEHPAPSIFLDIAGWPALQRRQELPFEVPSHVPVVVQRESAPRLTTAVAMENLLVRLEGFLPPGAEALAADEAEVIGLSLFTTAVPDRSAVQAAIDDLRARPALRDASGVPPGGILHGDTNSDGKVDVGDVIFLLNHLFFGGAQPEPAFCGEGAAAVRGGDMNDDRKVDLSDSIYLIAWLFASGPAPLCPSEDEGSGGAVTDTTGLNVRVNNGGGVDSEVEISVSTDGRNIIIANNQREYALSNDGGRTFNLLNVNPGFPANGDPSLGFGATGAFYFAYIAFPDGTAAANNVQGCSTGVSVSTNNGGVFNFRNNAVLCPFSGANMCFTDQEHIAADRWNLAPGGGDQVYSVWRNFTPGMTPPANCSGIGSGNVTAQVVCSQDSAQNWTAGVGLGAGADFPRVAVGFNGLVYVVYRAGNNIMLNRYSSCANGLALQGAVTTVAAGITDVACPALPGLDRCNDGNILSSHMVAPDDLDPNHVYAAYAVSTGAGNEDILVRDSIDGGVSFPAARVVRVNRPVPGRRYMPWISVIEGVAHVSWYDRRLATAQQNDLTDYFRGSAFRDGAGNLVAGAEVRITRASDPACASGWPGTVRNAQNSESCSVQPQLAGLCQDNNAMTADSNQPCDISAGGCPMGETCMFAGGTPKYGDYNGNATAAGRLYTAWASAVSPPGIAPASVDIDVFTSIDIVGNVPQIQVPGGIIFSDTCVGDSLQETLFVCNTGTANLEIGPITSSNARFAVTMPSSGYPVIVSPDFCFPFQVVFTPTTNGVQNATLTIPSNDTVNLLVQVAVTGEGVRPRISTVVADFGDFGDVCTGSHRDLELIVNNSGGCDLAISNMTSSLPDFQIASVMTFPLLVDAGDSLHLPVRFAPSSFGAKSGTISIETNDPETPTKQVAFDGFAPSGDIRVTGSTDFGDVCADELAEKTISVCNVGACNLNVTSVAFEPPCADFTIINNPFPAPVSPDFCLGLVIRFTPTSSGPKTCILAIRSDDPDMPVVMLAVTANTPDPSIDVPPDQAFPATVVSTLEACESLVYFPISNTGSCNLTLTDVKISAGGAEYSILGLPSFPIILQPGHIAGEGDLRLSFAPDQIGRARTGQISVTYVSDPVSGSTTTVTRSLCGEGVRTGARVLVTAAGVPVANVEKIHLQRINANRNRDAAELDTVDQAMNLAPVIVTPGAPCVPFTYHREYGAESNISQLLPGFFQVTVTAVVGGKRQTKIVGFNVDTCDFDANIKVEF